MSRKIWIGSIVKILIYYLKTSFAVPLIGNTEQAEKGEFPFIVSLSNRSNFMDIDNHFCAGTLISKKHVLTAHHCMENENNRNAVVIVNTINFDSGQIYEIGSYEPYDSWKLSTSDVNDNNDESHDIGIITLKQEVKNAQPATISNRTAEELFGAKVITAGWGFTNQINRTRPKTLLKASLKILNLEEYKKYTKKRYGKAKIPQAQYYYTMADPPVLLGGSDSGGPLVLKGTNELVGVNYGAWVGSHALPPRYSSSAHTRIDYAKHRQFILETIREYL